MKLDSRTIRDKEQITIDIPNYQDLKLNDKFFFIGSCFSTEMSSRLSERLIPTVSNPFGVVFNPITIFNQLNYIFSGDDNYLGLTLHEGKWHALNLSNKFQSENKDDLIEMVSNIRETALKNIIESSQIVITLGTTFTWRHLKLNSIIGNCHKIPQSEFKKEKTSYQRVVESLETIVCLIAKLTQAKVTFTVSPVRYLRDGIINNTASKAILRSAIEDLTEQNNSISYFPSYEIFTEELKDSRYYKNDLAHPNEWAADYIFLRWIETQSNHEFQKYIQEAQQYYLMNNHKTEKLSDEQKVEWLSKIEIEKARLYNIYSEK